LYSDCTCYNCPKIKKNFFNDEIIGFYLSSIDLESGESTTLLFDYSIDLSDALFSEDCGTSSTHDISKLYVSFDISMFIPGLMEETKQLVDGKVRFDINSNTISDISFRNTDLNFETTQLAGNTDFSLEEYNLSVTDDDIEEIADLFLSLGRAPNGVYNFNFILENENNTEIDQVSETVEIFVPSYLDLITPGSVDLSDSLSNIVMSFNPTFQWNSDYCNKCDFSIRVSEFRANDHSSLQEALEDYSVLPINSGYYALSSNINSFQYPASGAGEIIPGRLYVWQVRRTYNTSNGTMEEFSPIFLFKVQDTQSVEPPVVSQDVNLENIKLLIGVDNYESLFGESGQLKDFNSVNSSMILNNQNISINYLIDLINKKSQGEINIMNVDVQ
tara:strand:- start:5519 stop:6682 length:1164 start_codon:yes stop_codon:yes gene_type:complete